ncbi:MAG: IS110 family transposase [Euryarchaeota archaeon]|nr:IS110 family transposase [Euryarchaeota archaeon]
MRHVIALDVHKRETQACVMTQDGTVLGEKRFRTSRPSYRRALKMLSPAPVVIETVGMHRPVALWLQELDFDVHLANTSRIPKPVVKTDKKDARHLADLYRANLLPESYLAPEEVQRLRDLARHRQFLGQESRRLRGKLMHDLIKHGHFREKNPVLTQDGRKWLRTLGIPEVESTLKLVEQIQGEIRDFEERIGKETTDLPEAGLLMTIPGVGAYTALLILAEVGDFTRFKDKDALGAYAGLGVRQHQSGDTDRRGSITKQGNGLLRWALVEAARNHVRVCPDSALARRCKRLEARKGYGKAITATARVMATVMFTMVARKEAFQVNHP